MRVAIVADFPLAALEDVRLGDDLRPGASWLPQLASAWEEETEIEIHWVIPWHKGKAKLEIVRWNQRFHVLPCAGITLSMLLGRWPQKRLFRKLLGRVEPDLIHVWGSENLTGAALSCFDGPKLFSLQGILSRLRQTSELKGLRWAAFERWEKESLRLADWVSCESAWGCRQLKPEPRRVEQIEYGVDDVFFGTPWEPDRRDPRVVFVGALTRLKGADYLLEMLRRFPKRSWKMVFVGDGPLADELRALNDPMVEVLGRMNREQVAKVLRTSWLLVHPSRADTSPNAVKEARVVGLPVVGSPNGGHAEYIDSGSDGLIVDSEIASDWFTAIDQMCGNFEACCVMGKRRHQWFREHFRPEHTAKAFSGLYRKMVSRAGNVG